MTTKPDFTLCPSCGYVVGRIEQLEAEIARLADDNRRLAESGWTADETLKANLADAQEQKRRQAAW